MPRPLPHATVLQGGDIAYVPPSYGNQTADSIAHACALLGHYIENTGNTTLHYLEILKSDKFQDIILNQVRGFEHLRRTVYDSYRCS